MGAEGLEVITLYVSAVLYALSSFDGIDGYFLFSDSVAILSAVYTDVNEQNYSQLVTVLVCL